MEGSRCRKAGTEHLGTARSGNGEFWLCPLGRQLVIPLLPLCSAQQGELGSSYSGDAESVWEVKFDSFPCNTGISANI